LGDLAGTTFVSTRVSDDPPVVPGTQIRLGFSQRSLTASAGCNLIGGDATYRDGVLRVDGPLSMTEMACPEPMMRQDGWLANLLTGDPAVRVDGDRLTLTSGDTVVEFLDDDVVNPDRPLVGTEWRLESIGAGTSADSAVSSVPGEVESTLSIDADGRVSVSPGCNTGGGQATIDDGIIRFESMAYTLMACEDPRGEVEAAVIPVLDGAVHYAIDADLLTLTKDGRTLTYRAA
jgi:heat shock protein HslJ